MLAVDPSSPFTGGAILGDRVRMQDHALDDGVFIRSMATRGHLGGLSLAVPEAVRVLGATGSPLVIVETVGVGQMEVEVASAADTTVVVVNPGWGDAVQANKAGLLEVADVFVINKADRPGARETRRDLEQMLDLSAPGDWRPPIVETVAATGEGVDGPVGRDRPAPGLPGGRGLPGRSRRSRLERESAVFCGPAIEEEVDDLGSEPRFAGLVRRWREPGSTPTRPPRSSSAVGQDALGRAPPEHVRHAAGLCSARFPPARSCRRSRRRARCTGAVREDGRRRSVHGSGAIRPGRAPDDGVALVSSTGRR